MDSYKTKNHKQTSTDLKPVRCPTFITSICPVCGIIVGGRQRHPDAEGIGIENVVKALNNG